MAAAPLARLEIVSGGVHAAIPEHVSGFAAATGNLLVCRDDTAVKATVHCLTVATTTIAFL
jgi:hypothetical protein